MKKKITILVGLCCCWSALASDTAFERQLLRHAEQSSEAMRLCRRYAEAWLAHADPETGLLPRNLTRDLHWNAKDAAADNYPFLALTAQVAGLYHLERAALHILEQEMTFTNRLGALPDTFDFRTKVFLNEVMDIDDMVFGASEYIKDGLMPLVEWVGPSPWLDRMKALSRALYEHTESVMPPESVPSRNIEVCGELTQSMSRLYWRTGDVWYKERCYALADRHLLESPVSALERIPLRDHGCEIIGGLSEVYVIAALEDPGKHKQYRGPLYALLDMILDKGVNEHGMMPDWFNPRTGEQDWKRPSDGWGYVYNAFLTVAQVDDNLRYRDAARHALLNVHRYLGADWERGSADGYADSIEGALNLLNRLPVATAFGWVDESMWHIFARQRDDGVIEGWHGDGNSARTAMMYALWKTQGATVRPWRDDVRLGAALDDAGTLHLLLESDWLWRGILRLDRPRHREYLNMPLDYPRINQFPEWFVAEKDAEYAVSINGETPKTMPGEALWNLPLALEPGGRLHITVRPMSSSTPVSIAAGPAFRTMGYSRRSAREATAWQEILRAELARLLRIRLDAEARPAMPIEAERQAGETTPRYQRYDVLLNTAPGRVIPAILTLPTSHGGGPFPAVVCIHGHGGMRERVYEAETVYNAFAAELAASGVITIAVDVGQHDIGHPDATLMGERLWDLIRCVDYLKTLPEVDAARIGCAGLSLGGEMAMWLGALDTRVCAVVSAGFLTVMNQMELNHCMCWDFDGLRALADFPDIYALIAPRPLLCQIGRQEPLSQFNVVVAERAFAQLRQVYEDLNATDNAQLRLHAGGHEMHLPSMRAFLLGRLGGGPQTSSEQ